MLNLVFGTTVQACFISSSLTVAPSFFGYCSVTKSGALNILPAVNYKRKLRNHYIKYVKLFKIHQFLCVLHNGLITGNRFSEFFL